MELLGWHIPLWPLLTMCLTYIIYKYTTRTFNKFKDQGIPGPFPLPILGTIHYALWKGVRAHDVYMVQKYGKLVATFVSARPGLMVADVDILKQIFVKEFSSFTDRRANVDMVEKPLDEMLTILSGDKWRNIRTTISPTFSSGKLRRMKHQMNHCSKVLVENLKEKAESGEPFNVKDFMGSFSMDVIASTAFGLDINSQRDPNNPFLKHAKKAFGGRLTNPLILVFIFAPFLLPFFRKVFGLTFFPKDTSKFFRGILDQAMECRAKDDETSRTDFLQLLINAHNEEMDDSEMDVASSHAGGRKKGLTHDEILGQGFLFFVAGYVTVSDTLTMLLYYLAQNPEIQNRVLEDITSVLGDDEEPDYDSVGKMHYLAMAIEETLRLSPPAPRLERHCTNPITINGIHFTKNLRVAIPMMALHLDPEIWPEPEKFDPERFSPELKAERDPFYWMPFGHGPRNCIGMRLALMEIKMALVYVLRNFEIVTCMETTTKMKKNWISGQPQVVMLCVNERK